jgi:uncharacterized membrane protein
MDVFDRLSLFTTLDFVAVTGLILAAVLIGWRIEHAPAHTPSVSAMMDQYRREWMQQMVTRDPRIFDAQILGGLRQGPAFFASTAVIALGGTLALIGNAEQLAGVALDLAAASHPTIVWEVKLLILALFLTNAFLKFAWSNRLFGYSAVLLGATPNRTDDPNAYHRAGQAAEITITAARSFNRGLRSVYFALAAATWLAGPVALLLATLVTLVLIWRREFASTSRQILARREAPPPTTSAK